MTAAAAKRRAATAALDLVRPGMRLGLGTGSTAALFVDLLGERVRGGLEVRCVPTSEVTARQAGERGLQLIELGAEGVDLAVDGSDEVADDLTLIKGGGGALLREKIVAAAARRFVVIADRSKRVGHVGAFALPVEIDRFGAARTCEAVSRAARNAGVEPQSCLLRRDEAGAPARTDGGHWLLDLACGQISDVAALAAALAAVPGVVEHGLFVGLADFVLIGTEEGVERWPE